MCEVADVYITKNRKARKRHVCCECGNPIEKGEKYAYSSGVFDGSGFSYKRCTSCHDLLTYIWALPDVECIDDSLPQFLVDSDWVWKDDRSDDNEPWRPSVDFLKWENNRWMLSKEVEV